MLIFFHKFSVNLMLVRAKNLFTDLFCVTLELFQVPAVVLMPQFDNMTHWFVCFMRAWQWRQDFLLFLQIQTFSVNYDGVHFKTFSSLK